MASGNWRLSTQSSLSGGQCPFERQEYVIRQISMSLIGEAHITLAWACQQYPHASGRAAPGFGGAGVYCANFRLPKWVKNDGRHSLQIESAAGGRVDEPVGRGTPLRTAKAIVASRSQAHSMPPGGAPGSSISEAPAEPRPQRQHAPGRPIPVRMRGMIDNPAPLNHRRDISRSSCGFRPAWAVFGGMIAVVPRTRSNRRIQRYLPSRRD